MIIRFFSASVFFVISLCGFSQVIPSYWHNKEREVRYKPDGEDFIIENGTRRFNRALYGGNSAFRVETGDIPEFSMYLPGMGGNIKIGIARGDQSKWISEASKYVARSSPGKMTYLITDPLLGNGSLSVTVLALYEKEGIIVKIDNNQTPSDLEIFISYGGVTGKKFNRDGDLNVDPESNFYLKPEYCSGNSFKISRNNFILTYYTGTVPTEAERYENPVPGTQLQKPGSNPQAKGTSLYLNGLFPETAVVKVSDASAADFPLIFFASTAQNAPALCAKLKPEGTSYFMVLNKPDAEYKYIDAPEIFANADKERLKYANRIKVVTPDKYLNTLGGVLGYAADAIWETPTFLHGAIGWRMRLNGWRGPYTGDVLGWHDRARNHFEAYSASQVLSPDSGPSVPDPKYNLAREEEKMGNALFTSGYICRNPYENDRPHHYDMNLVFIDALLRHYQWTGDLDFVKKSWPVLKRHIEWEKRNFGTGRDGLYDAYCCIWASDALYYSGGEVAHSSAYNYFSNKTMAYLAGLIGEDPSPYKKEAETIKAAMEKLLWCPSLGWYAEYRDYLGLKQVHQSAAVWTVYHTIDSEVPDNFEAYQMTEYVNHEIPHIPVLAKGLSEKNNYVISTSNWMPYAWSINNVVFAENLHTALSFWQAGRDRDAMDLFKGSVLDAMYLGGSPGNFVQLSYYDAARGESYRDFGDEIGMASRALVEGLFGIRPNLLDGTVTINPGFPEEWDHASISIPDIQFSYKRSGDIVNYIIKPSFAKPVKIRFIAKPLSDRVVNVIVNGKPVEFKQEENSIGYPAIAFTTETGPDFEISIEYAGKKLSKVSANEFYALGDILSVNAPQSAILDLFDPQGVLKNPSKTLKNTKGTVNGALGHRTFFVKVKQNEMVWWEPVNIEIRKPFEIVTSDGQVASGIKFQLQNNTSSGADALITVNSGTKAFSLRIHADAKSLSADINVPAKNLINGYNTVTVDVAGKPVYTQLIADWMADNPSSEKYEKVDLRTIFNDKVTNIFKNQYLTPRCPYPTLALPVTGIGDWCSTDVKTNIDDSGVRKNAGIKNEIITPQGIPFSTPGASDADNIIFTSQWDNYPDEVSIPVNQSASHAYFLMAGSTNWMQSRFPNATVYAIYTDASKDSLVLRNPETWFPIEQDYYADGYAFNFDAPRPLRLYLKTAKFTFENNSVRPDFGYNGGQIDGGAAIVLDLPLNQSKTVKNFVLKTTANDVVVGLMSLTLAR
jgi:hypothetical protein